MAFNKDEVKNIKAVFCKDGCNKKPLTICQRFLRCLCLSIKQADIKMIFNLC